MSSTHYDLGHRRRGEIIEVVLKGSAANVRLLDNSNLQSYRSGRSHRFHGGLAKRSPVRLQIPHSGHWHVTVDMNGLRGKVRSSVRILPGPLPSIQDSPLNSIPSLVHKPVHSPIDLSPDGRTFDVFISHASEEKDVVVRQLATALQAAGLSVWYDEFELSIGDSLRRKIDHGLANSRFGIVILSQAFFRKGWTNYELDGLVTLSVSGDQVLLPIWHNISRQEVMAFSPSLADKVARDTAAYTVEEIAEEIAELIHRVSDGV